MRNGNIDMCNDVAKAFFLYFILQKQGQEVSIKFKLSLAVLTLRTTITKSVNLCVSVICAHTYAKKTSCYVLYTGDNQRYYIKVDRLCTFKLRLSRAQRISLLSIC